jgi:hypothetical protein
MEVVSKLFIREFRHQMNSPWVFLFFIHAFFHTDFCRFNVRYNNISVSSLEPDSKLRAISSAIPHFARQQETTSQWVPSVNARYWSVVSHLPILFPFTACAHTCLFISRIRHASIDWWIWNMSGNMGCYTQRHKYIYIYITSIHTIYVRETIK